MRSDFGEKQLEPLQTIAENIKICVPKTRAGQIAGDSECAGEVAGDAECAGEVAGDAECAGEVAGDAECAGQVAGNTECAGEIAGGAECAGEVAGDVECAGEVAGEAGKAARQAAPNAPMSFILKSAPAVSDDTDSQSLPYLNADDLFIMKASSECKSKD